MYVYVCIYTYPDIHEICMYIYIFLPVYICIYVYIYTHAKKLVVKMPSRSHKDENCLFQPLRKSF